MIKRYLNNLRRMAPQFEWEAEPRPGGVYCFWAKYRGRKSGVWLLEYPHISAREIIALVTDGFRKKFEFTELVVAA